VAGSHEHSNELLDFIESKDFFDQVSIISFSRRTLISGINYIGIKRNTIVMFVI